MNYIGKIKPIRCCVCGVHGDKDFNSNLLTVKGVTICNHCAKIALANYEEKLTHA